MEERAFGEVVRTRRATPSFEPTAVDESSLKRMLEMAASAPSGSNTQPWRFVVVRDPEQRRRLRKAAMNQAKVEEAPVVVVACGDLQDTVERGLDEVMSISREHGFEDPGGKRAASIKAFLTERPGEAAGKSPDMGLWLNRHVMIAFTTLMWAAEVLGYDTAPMEGFEEAQVREVLGIPSHVRVVALLAIGRLKGTDKKYAGRLPTSRVFFDNAWGKGLRT